MDFYHHDRFDYLLLSWRLRLVDVDHHKGGDIMSFEVLSYPVVAVTPSVLYGEVLHQIAHGFDIQTRTAVSFENELFLYMTPRVCVSEYVLVEATNLNDLHRTVAHCNTMGFQLIFDVVLFKGFYLHWMARPKQEKVIGQIEVITDMHLVEGEQHVHMVVGEPLFSSWHKNPFTVHLLGGNHD